MAAAAAPRALRPDALLTRLRRPGAALDGLYVVAGDEPLLLTETGDALRTAARQGGYTERTTHVLDARSDWQQVTAATGTASLFGDRQLLELRLPGGKPGKVGGEALSALARQAAGPAGDALFVVFLPRPDRTMRAAPWFVALAQHGVLVEVPTIDMGALPEWIGQRLAAQQQHTDRATLQWIAERVEGNLLAAHQEVLKLGLSFPTGALSAEQVQDAVMNVARYNAFKLRDAIQAGQATRAARMIAGLRAEGEALPLVLWAVTQAWARAPGQISADIIRHAHDIDRLIKGLSATGRLPDPWQELTRLALRLCQIAPSLRH